MKATILFSCRMYGISFWEANIEHDGKVHRKDISFRHLKKLGAVKSFNGHKKAETWLNDTEEGQAYLRDLIGVKEDAS
ncbi:hypothetical protein [Paenibacillus harenae]|uniref:hypothetical protein n=1 Tax=Paenibacillus harenae TaxID=306543 RepID=UPI000406CF3B|nr:hypothetical protein [Paenibacillus harenae]